MKIQKPKWRWGGQRITRKEMYKCDNPACQKVFVAYAAQRYRKRQYCCIDCANKDKHRDTKGQFHGRDS